MSIYKGQKAFNLLEVSIVLAILSFMAFLAYPYIQDMLYAAESNRVENYFILALREAKSRSYITKKDVMLCTLDQNGNCSRQAQETLSLFHDMNDNNKKDATDEVLAVYAWQIRYGDILLRTSATRDYIRYMGDTSKPRGHIGHLRYCSPSKNKKLSFKVIFNMHGHIRVERADLVDVGCPLIL